jgi:hypothetical protein
LAGVRRATGVNVGKMVNERLTSFWARRTSDAFFKSGEFVVDKSIEFLAKTKTNAHLANTGEKLGERVEKFGDKVEKMGENMQKKKSDF